MAIGFSFFLHRLGPGPAVTGKSHPSVTGGSFLSVPTESGLQVHSFWSCSFDTCQRGMSVGFTTAAALVHELMEARDERRLLHL